MKKSEVYVPLNRRLPNAVDRLKKQIDGLETKIAKIQGRCRHDFRLTKRPELTRYESKVKGVFIDFNAAGRDGRPTIHFRCLLCSKEVSARISVVCPRCLGKMEEGQCMGAGSREKYFGEPHLYYSVKPSTCRDCGFTVVSDEWDQ